MSGKTPLLLFHFFLTFLSAATLEKESACPLTNLEKCRWVVDARVEDRERVSFEWEKSVVSRRREKPLASALQCNVDREFDYAAGGYIRVWFVGDSDYCDPMHSNPTDCGVTFLLDEPGVIESARGFRVEAPSGKVLERVEHFSTLNLQCGDFTSKQFASSKWNARIGWKRGGAGDGTYVGS